MMFFVYIAESTIGSDLLWFVGDNFTVKSFRGHYKRVTPEADKHFIKENYEYAVFANSRYASSQTNMLAQIQNTVAQVVGSNKKSGLMAKYVIIVLDDDLISYLDSGLEENGLATVFGTWIEWISKEINSLIDCRLGQLPLKLKKYRPFIYWVAAPIHHFFSKGSNQKRIKFNLSLESVVRAHENNNMRVMRIKDGWNTQDSKLVINDRISEVGLTTYWSAIDASFKYNSIRRETFLAKQLSTAGTSTGIPSQMRSFPQREESQRSRDRSRSPVRRNRETSSPSSRDPMGSFFRRHTDYDTGYRRGTYEDQPRCYSRRRDFNCFMLPRLN